MFIYIELVVLLVKVEFKGEGKGRGGGREGREGSGGECVQPSQIHKI